MKWPNYSEECINDVISVLRSHNVNQWTGDKVKKFEKEYAEYFGTKYAVAVFNGTVALELAFIAIDIKPGDEVITTSRSFIASISSIVRCGGVPVFVDCDDNQNINPDLIEEKITNKTKAILCVHLAGMPCEMDKIIDISNKYNLFVIEDCAQCHGAKYKGKYCGSFGHINAFSFCQDKIISTGGEGGMITTNDEKLYKKAWSFKDHGKDYDLVFNSTSQTNALSFKWLHSSLGTNWRMTEIQATIGLIQLKELKEMIEHRRKIANIYNKKLDKHKAIYIPSFTDDYYHSYYKFYFYLKLEELTEDRQKILEEISKINIPIFQGTCGEMYLEKGFLNLIPKKPCINSRDLSKRSMMLLTDPTISEKRAKEITVEINKILNKYLK